MHVYVKSILSALISRHKLDLVLTIVPPDYEADAEITFHMPSNPSFKTNLSLQIGPGYCMLNEYGYNTDGELDSVRAAANYDERTIYQTNDWAAEILSKVLGRDITTKPKTDSGEEVAYVSVRLQKELNIFRHSFPFRTSITLGANVNSAFLNFIHHDHPGLRHSMSVRITPERTLLMRNDYNKDGTLSEVFVMKSYSTAEIHSSDAWVVQIVTALLDGVNVAKPSVIWAATYHIPDTAARGPGNHLNIEDGGQAVIFHRDPVSELNGDGQFFVKLQSWAESLDGDMAENHKVMKSLLGRKVRVTIETID